MGKLKGFSFQPPKSACVVCSMDYGAGIEKAREHVGEYFDGLLLDCMDDKSQPKTGDGDKDYWLHNDLPEEATVHGCQFDHKQPTWYFSFMGRKDDRDRLRKGRRSSRSGGYGDLPFRQPF